ncbi:methionyl-tRNA formyltransferase [Fundicoccus sp. Sow4_H7]|uniref:methionyl-tRNA formyltransferase n=1 Tax=Fundicoccus sp. Sow4_H7 TaxID=3438784 RepID=UPI003F8F8093
MTSIIFMGTAEFSAAVLQRLIDEDYQIKAVVSQPDRPVGRKRKLQATAVKELAIENQIEVFQAEKLSGSQEMEALLSKEADFIVTAAYGQYVPKKLLQHPKYVALNVHASLLPKYRGAAPIQYSIWNGDSQTGVSIMKMVPEMDAGDIYSQRVLDISSEDDAGDIFEKLAVIGADLLVETLDAILNDRIEPQAQNPDLVSYAPMLKREDEQLDWTKSAKEIDQHIRAFRPNPSTYTWLNEQRLKIWAGFPMKDFKCHGEPGEILAVNPDHIVVQAANDSFFAITEWQESGKKRMTIKQTYNGLTVSDWLGQKFYRK